MTVQQGLITDFGAGEDTTTATITSVDTDHAFARLTNVMHFSGGETSGGLAAINMNDLGAGCLLTDSTTVTFDRLSSGENVDVSVAYEVVEFPSTGNDAAFVRMHQDITLAGGTATSDTAISGVSTIGDCVPVICGITHSSTGNQDERAMVSAQIIDDSGAKIRLTRGDSTNTTVVSVAVIEFTGSNWTVQQNISHTQTTIDTVETETVTAVTWDETMIFSSRHCSSDDAEAFLVGVWPGATTTTLKFYSGDVNTQTYAFLVSNSNLDVESINSFDGSESQLNADGSDPMTIDVTVSSSTLADHMVIATFGTGNNNQQTQHWAYNYYLTSTTNLRFWSGASGAGQDPDWAAQLIDISGLSSGSTDTAITVPTGPWR